MKNSIDWKLVDGILWDMDGVLVSEETSCLMAVLKTVQLECPDENYEFSDVKKLKKIVGFNNDWDCTYVLAEKINPEEFLINAEKYRATDRYEALQKIHQNFYLGTELLAKFYGQKVEGEKTKGMIHEEKGLVSKEDLTIISRKFAKMGIVTGRPFFEAQFALQNLETSQFFKGIVGMEDTLKHKPDPEPILLAMRRLHLKNPVYIGDTKNDFLAAKSAGLNCIIVNPEKMKGVDFQVQTHEELMDILKNPRIFRLARNTSETQIECLLDLDGNGEYEIETPIGFLTHMVEGFARHGGFDLTLKVAGDTYIDDHHTVEDVAIVLGKAFKQAIDDKKGINRYGFFMLPMDECLTTVAFDFSGRYSFHLVADFSRENVGEMATEMIYHFWDSFAQNAGANLIIKSEFGTNDHHKAEGIFKAAAKAIKIACAKDYSKLHQIPSTKGLL